ncbi:MAG: TetR/AcrR family transcriptional regulator [Bacteroidia bacterium]
MPVTKVSKQEILHRCWEHFHRNGYHNSSIKDLAEAAGLGKAGLLHHFGSKEGIMSAVIDYAMEQVRDYVLAVAKENLPFEQRLEKLLRRHCRLAKIDGRGCFFANIILETGQKGTFNDIMLPFLKEWEIVVGELLTEVMPEKEAKEKAYRMIVEFEGAVVFYKLTGDPDYLEKYVVNAVAPFKPKT